MIRVLQVTDKICQRWGVANVIMNYYRFIDTTKVQFDFLVNEVDEELKSEIEERGGRIYYFPVFSLSGLLHLTSVFDNFFKNHAADYNIIHSHFFQLNYWLFKSAKKYGVDNRISHSHATRFSANGAMKNVRNGIMNKFGLLYTNYFFSCGCEAGLNMFGYKRYNSSRSFLIRNAIDVPKYSFNLEVRRRVRDKLGLNEKHYLLGISASLSERKNQRFIIKLLPELLRYDKDIKLLLLGDGDSKQELQSLCSVLDVNDYVFFMGTVTNVEDYLQTVDCFLLPSKLEGLPLSVVEAEAAGLRCVLSDVVTNEVNIDNMCEYCSLADKKQWVDAILGSKGYERLNTFDVICENHYYIKNESEILAEIYESMNKKHNLII